MYREARKTFNPFVGCRFNCVYCKPSFQRLMRRQKKRCIKCYMYEPHFHVERLRQTPPRTVGDEFIFLCDCGDVSFMSPQEWELLLEYVEKWSDRIFLIQSKSPICFTKYNFPSNVILGTTIETNKINFNIEGCKYKSYREISNAPLPEERYKAMLKVKHRRKAVTVEPILDFDLDVLVSWILNIKPEFVYVGYDNHNCSLPEPKLEKTLKLIAELESKGMIVRRKTLRKAWYE